MSTPTAQTPKLAEASTVTPRTIIAVGALLPSVAILAVASRFYVRIRTTKSLGFDDYLILFALILTLALGIMMIVGSAVHALAQPTPLGDGPEGFLVVLNDAIVTTEKMKWVFNLIQVIVLGTIKLSVIFFYRRIFRGKTFDLYSKGMIALVSAWTIAFFFTVFFECGTHFEYLWSTLLDLLTHCTNDLMYLKAYAISDVITDGLILLMPIPIIWRLQMSLDRRLAVCSVFLLGTVAVAAGLARVMIFLSQLADGFSLSQGILIISTWMYWSMLELGLSIVAACLPTLRPLFRDWSFQGLYKTLRSYVILQSKNSSESSHKFSKFKDGPSEGDEDESRQSQNPNKKRTANSNVATHIYPLHDLEAQADKADQTITIKSRIEQTSDTW